MSKITYHFMPKLIYTIEQIMDRFDILPPHRKTEILNDAIDYMQSYNGQSKEEVIAKSMGYTQLDKRGWIKGRLHNCPKCQCS
jgi:hypothetical protein